MNRLTFDNIYQHLQSKGIKCSISTLGVKVYANHTYIGVFRAVHGQCVFRGDTFISFNNTQHRIRKMLDLFECDRVTLQRDCYIYYYAKIKTIKEVSDEQINTNIFTYPNLRV